MQKLITSDHCIKRTILLALFLLSLSACAPAPQTEVQATGQPSITETQLSTLTLTSTLTQTPRSTVTNTLEPTQTFTPSITPEPTPRRGVFINIFCFNVTQAIENNPSIPSEPITETLGRVLAGAGLLFTANADGCDAVLYLDFTFIPKSYDYKVEGSDQPATCFTGAALRGTADLNWQGSSLYHRDLLGEFIPAGGTSSCPEPENAPFVSVWPQAAMEALTEIWGKNVLVPALMDPFRVVRDAGAHSLPLLSEAEILSFLPFLSTALSDTSEVVRLRTLEALLCCADNEAVIELTSDLIAALQVEQVPDTAQAFVNLLVEIAGERGMDAEIVPAFKQILEDSPPYPQSLTPNMMILKGIAQLGPLGIDTVPALIKLLSESNDPTFTDHILAALTAISGEDFGTDPQAWSTWYEGR